MKIKSFPFFKQMDSMDCGPTCLKIIAAYYGKKFRNDYLRECCNIGKDGVSLFGISEAAELLGFKTIGGKFTYQDFTESVPLPSIIYWNQNHFVVVYKIQKSNPFRKGIKICIADPKIGLVEYSKEEFMENWISTKNNEHEKGIALLFEPTKSFFKKSNDEFNENSLKFLLGYFIKFKKHFIQLLIGLLLGSLMLLIFPFLTQSIVDIGIYEKNLQFVYLVLIAQLILVISRMSVDFIRRWILLHISARINISLISDFFIKLMRLPMAFFDTKLMGDLIQRIEDHKRIERFLTVQSLNVLFLIFNIVVFSIVLLIYSLKIFVIFVAGSIIYTFWIFLFFKKRRQLDYQKFEQNSQNSSKTIQLITGMQEIKLQNCEQRKRWEWEDVQANLYKLNISSLSLEQYQEAGSISINEVKNVLITVIAATSVISGDITLGMMLSIQFIIGQLNSPIEQIVKFAYTFQDMKISIERINDIHLKEIEDSFSKSKVLNKNLDDLNIYIHNLSFQYGGKNSNKVLDNIDILIPSGKVTAIVGTSGSGKTTLIKLLLRYYNITQGKISIGDRNLNEFNTTFWRNQCGVVMQNGYIFSDSIARNIAVSDDEINLDRLKFAAKTANIHDFIRKLPLKYNTKIGQDGQVISQGEKQRILIARAIYKNPNYLFFDEATNSLDTNNEKLIIENLERLYKGKTVVIVAHRLSTVKNADQIVVLMNGKIVEVGNHKDLTLKKGEYFKLVKNQLELGT